MNPQYTKPEELNWENRYFELLEKFDKLDRKTEFFARSIYILDVCYGCERYEKDFMISFLAQDHKYSISDIDKVFDLFLDRADLEKLVEEAQKLLNK